MVHAYERLRHISTGRFGSAFLISRSAGGRLAMMKTIDIGRLDNSSRKQVLEEAAVLARLHHPHLTAVHECFVEGGHLCLVLQYADGGNAAGQIEKARRACVHLSEPQIMRWFAQATLGLKHLHDRSISHRDLRTRRLLLTAEGHVVLSGVAITALLKSTLCPERPDLEAMRYLSPELVAGKEHTSAGDMWALGAILYELASLLPPFDHSHPRGLAERILSGPPRALPPRCSKEMQDLCAKLLQRRAEDRLTSTATLCLPVIQERLHKLFDEEPAFVPGSSPALPSPSMQAVTGLPGRGGFGALLLKSPAATPRGLRTVGEQVTGVKCGGIGVTGSTALRGYSSRSPTASSVREDAFPDSKPGTPGRTSTARSSLVDVRKPSKTSGRMSSKTSCRSSLMHSDPQMVVTEMANVHAKVYAGIMVETAIEELNFSSSRLLEEDVPFGRFSLPTAVDSVSGASWRIDKEVPSAEARVQSPRCWDVVAPAHDRKFPRFSEALDGETSSPQGGSKRMSIFG